MGFTDVAWESRSTEQLARDLTEGPGPTPVGQAGASWVRVANELAAISEAYSALAERINGAFQGGSADAVARRIGDFGHWLQAMSLSAAGNGERAEEAAVAHGVAILAMPTVSEAVEAETTRDVMASLAAYNGAILNGHFAELDAAAEDAQTSAAAVMQRYEESCTGLAQAWDQPPPPDVSNGAARDGERAAQTVDGGGSGMAASGVASEPAPPPLGAFRVAEVKAGDDRKQSSSLSAVTATSAAGGGASGMGGYGPMGAAMARGDGNREHESSAGASTLAGGGEPGAGLAESGSSWLPTAAQSDAPLLVSNVSWGPATSVFDSLIVPAEPEAPAYADSPPQTMQQVSDHWVSPAVIGNGEEAES